MNTKDSSVFYERDLRNHSEERLEDNEMRLKRDWEVSSKLLGVITPEIKTLMHEESTLCWCQPDLEIQGDYYIVIHNHKNASDA